MLRNPPTHIDPGFQYVITLYTLDVKSGSHDISVKLLKATINTIPEVVRLIFTVVA
jgi:hypothetical protein